MQEVACNNELVSPAFIKKFVYSNLIICENIYPLQVLQRYTKSYVFEA